MSTVLYLDQMGPSQFDVLKYVDQGKVFGKVHTALAHGKCLGVSALVMPSPFLLDVRFWCALLWCISSGAP